MSMSGLNLEQMGSREESGGYAGDGVYKLVVRLSMVCLHSISTPHLEVNGFNKSSSVISILKMYAKFFVVTLAALVVATPIEKRTAAQIVVCFY